MFKFLIQSFITLTIIAIIAVVGVFHYYNQDLPEYSQLANYKPPSVTRLYASNGSLLEEYANEHRLFTPIKAIPKSLIEAFISAEDKNFYEHQGIDLISTVKAIILNIANIAQNKRMKGASTITQQVVRNFLLTSERSLARKVKEAILSYRISKVFNKDQILELYLNQIYLGKNSYGVAAAALAYFDKSVEELDLAESAFLAALPKAPSYYDKNYDKARSRRNYVIYRMVEDGYITNEVAKSALTEPIKFATPKINTNFSGGYYAEHIRGEIIEKYGENVLYQEGLTVVTSLNQRYQAWAEEALREGIRKFDMNKGYRGPIGKININDWQNLIKKIYPPEGLLEYKIALVLETKNKDSLLIGLTDGSKANIPIKFYSWALRSKQNINNILQPGDVIIVEKIEGSYALRQIPEVNGSLIALKPSTGQVLAMCGGYDFSASKFNRSTQALRQPGSSIKTFVYLAGFENDLTPNQIFVDEPIELFQGPGLPMWKPKNYSKKYLGPITMRTGFERSANMVTIKVAQEIGINKVAEIIKRLGINDSPPNFYSSVLGSIETTPMKLTNAYAVLLNSGNYVTPHFIELIQDRNGETLYNRSGQDCKSSMQDINLIPTLIQKKTVNLVEENNNYQIISLLVGAVQNGNAKRAKILGPNIGGKSGTSNDSKDTWFLGFKNDLVVSVYVGYDTPRTLGANAQGSNVALPIFIDFMSKVVSEDPPLPFPVPSGIKLVNVNPLNGEITDSGGIVESFKTKERTEKSIEDVFDLID